MKQMINDGILVFHSQDTLNNHTNKVPSTKQKKTW